MGEKLYTIKDIKKAYKKGMLASGALSLLTKKQIKEMVSDYTNKILQTNPED